MEITIILSFLWVACNVLTLAFATNSMPNTDISVEDCFGENQYYNDVHIYDEPNPRSSNSLVTSMIVV